VLATATGPLGTYLTGANGKTLYFFTEDTSGDATACTDPECRGTWPPATNPEGAPPPAAPSGATGTVTTFIRSDDSTVQVAYDGHPLYYFAGDSKAGDTNGEGIGGVWFVADVTGAIPSAAASAGVPGQASAAPSAAASAAASSAAASGATDSLTIASVTGPLGTYLTGDSGKTIYFFAKDTSADASACTSAQCTGNWPAVTVAAGVAPTAGAGVTGTFTTFVRSDDGQTQIAYDGHPLYYFNGDQAAGQTNGEGIGGIWFVADVTGTLPAAAPASGAASAAPSAPPSTSGGYNY
jgi:predicted lipoprotein with Yx(FWY)xxD motif